MLISIALSYDYSSLFDKTQILSPFRDESVKARVAEFKRFSGILNLGAIEFHIFAKFVSLFKDPKQNCSLNRHRLIKKKMSMLRIVFSTLFSTPKALSLPILLLSQ